MHFDSKLKSEDWIITFQKSYPLIKFDYEISKSNNSKVSVIQVKNANCLIQIEINELGSCSIINMDLPSKIDGAVDKLFETKEELELILSEYQLIAAKKLVS